MNAAVAEPHERLSWMEICARYPDEWVMVTDIQPDDDESVEFDSALVLGHHPLRKEAHASMRDVLARYGSCGCFFTGKIRALPPRFPSRSRASTRTES